MKRFSTIVADPPWPYENSEKGAIVKTVKSDGSIAKGVQVHGNYQTMPIHMICRLIVPAKENCHLYLWTTNAFMQEAHEVASSWGFTVKTILTWVKMKDDGTPSMKSGYYYRGATEHCLFAVRGRLRLIGPAASTALLTQRLSHSVKPPEFYKLVEQQSPGPYLEMFSRSPRVGWDHWGNEVNSSIEIKSRIVRGY